MNKFLIIITIITLLIIDPLVLYIYNFAYNDTLGDSTLSKVNIEEPSKEFPNIPLSLRTDFKTDSSKINPKIEKSISGGPTKDGIPAIDNPNFEPLKNSKLEDNIKAIVLNDKGIRKVYPYNILVWHEIINDTINEIPVSITFSPLSGSAIAFNRTIDNKTLTLGVSGHLLEGNMIMYDKETESLWQQSTGKALAGEYLDKELKLFPLQVMNIGEIKKTYPKSIVLTENTGFERDYKNNPYFGYNESEDFRFNPSIVNRLYPQKEIFVVFKINEKVVGIPWLELKENISYDKIIDNKNIFIKKNRGELTLTIDKNVPIPFYFEMWFSLYAQNQDNIIILNPKE